MPNKEFSVIELPGALQQVKLKSLLSGIAFSDIMSGSWQTDFVTWTGVSILVKVCLLGKLENVASHSQALVSTVRWEVLVNDSAPMSVTSKLDSDLLEIFFFIKQWFRCLLRPFKFLQTLEQKLQVEFEAKDSESARVRVTVLSNKTFRLEHLLLPVCCSKYLFSPNVLLQSSHWSWA